MFVYYYIPTNNNTSTNYSQLNYLRVLWRCVVVDTFFRYHNSTRVNIFLSHMFLIRSSTPIAFHCEMKMEMVAKTTHTHFKHHFFLIAALPTKIFIYIKFAVKLSRPIFVQQL